MSSITLVLFLVIGLLLGSVSMIGTGKGTEALLLSRSFLNTQCCVWTRAQLLDSDQLDMRPALP